MSFISNQSLDINHEDRLYYYTVPEVAKILKVSKSYIYDLIGRKKINYIRLSERRTRIPASALENLQNIDYVGYNKVVQPPKRGRKANGSI